jgi:hypothetical protein
MKANEADDFPKPNSGNFQENGADALFAISESMKLVSDILLSFWY